MSTLRSDPYTHCDDTGSPRLIRIGDRDYPFSEEMVKKYPKLLDPAAVFTIGFEEVLPIIWEYPPSVLSSDLLTDHAKKSLFLSNCEFFEITLPDATILHLCKDLHKDVQDASEHLQGKAGKKGTRKIRVSSQDREVITFCADHEMAFRQARSDVLPGDIIRWLEIGSKELIDRVVLLDFKSQNLIFPFIKSFCEKFLA